MKCPVILLASIILCISSKNLKKLKCNAYFNLFTVHRTVAAVEEKTCGDWTALQPVKIGSGETKCFITTKNTQRCIMRYKVNSINITFLLYNFIKSLSEKSRLSGNEVHMLKILCWQQGLRTSLQRWRHLHRQVWWQAQAVCIEHTFLYFMSNIPAVSVENKRTSWLTSSPPSPGELWRSGSSLTRTTRISTLPHLTVAWHAAHRFSKFTWNLYIPKFDFRFHPIHRF